MRTVMLAIHKRSPVLFHGLVFLVFLIIGVVLYYQTRYAGRTMDFTGLMEQMITYGWKDVPTSMGFHANIPIAFFFYYLLYTLTNFHPIALFIFYLLLHVSNAFLVYRIVYRINALYTVRHAFVIAILSGLLFLIGPYQVEAVVWKVCLHYLLCIFFLLLAFYFLVRYFGQPSDRKIILITFFALLAFLTKEYAYVFPAIATIWVLYHRNLRIPTFSRKDWTLVLSLWALLPLYIVSNYVVLGKGVGHRIAEDIPNFDPLGVVSNIYKYIINHVTVLRWFGLKKQLNVHQWLEKHEIALGIFLAILVTAALYVLVKKVKKDRRRLSYFFLISFLLALLPSIFLFVSYSFYGESDRYGYYGATFLAPGMIYLFFTLRPVVRNILIVGYLLMYTGFTLELNTKWKENGIVHDALLNDFRWLDKDVVFILNIPNNYHGLFLYRSCSFNSTFEDSVRFVDQKPFNGKMFDVSQYNMMHLNEGSNVQPLDTNLYKVEYNQWGNWPWICAHSASNYENEYLKVEYISKGYKLYLKDIPKNSVFIYQDGLNWKEANIQFYDQD